MSFTQRYVSSSGVASYSLSISSLTPMSWATMKANATVADLINVRADGAYNIASSDSMSNAGSLTSPLYLRGYLNTPGDGYQGRSLGSGPLVTTNMPQIVYAANANLTSLGFTIWDSFNFTGNTNANLLSFSATSLGMAINSAFSNTNTSSSAAGVGVASANVNSTIFNCDLALSASANASAAAYVPGTNWTIRASRVNGGSGRVANLATTSSLLGIIGFAAGGVYVTGTGAVVMLDSSTLVGTGTGSGDGVNIITGNTTIQRITNNIITDWGGYGVNGVSAANSAIALWNRFDRNVAGATNLATDWLAALAYGNVNTSVLQSAEFMNAASGDYRLATTSPALGAGIFPYRDMGAAQSQASSSGGLIGTIGLGVGI